LIDSFIKQLIAYHIGYLFDTYVLKYLYKKIEIFVIVF